MSKEVAFWGKYNADTDAKLSLAAHCLDVGMVFRKLSEVDGINRTLQSATTVELENVILDRLAVLAMFHDIGKANLGFQKKIDPNSKFNAGHVRELVPLFEDPVLQERFLSVLPSELFDWFGNPYAAQSYFFAVFSHHGKPFSIDESRYGYSKLAQRYWGPQGLDPFEGVSEVVHWAREAFPDAFRSISATMPLEPRFHHVFAGLVMLSDWIGSHPDWFPISNVAYTNRYEHDTVVISHALKSIGLDCSELRPVMQAIGETFSDRFHFKPYPLQRLIDSLCPHDPNTELIIAESETGSGKTEAALNWFCKLFADGKVDGLYFALPTRVAARELYQRVHKTIVEWFPDPSCRPVVLLAVPGYTQVDGTDTSSTLSTPEEANLWQDDIELQKKERQWAAERPKRFLAATIAVGTVDQALLSIVQTSHAHLRSACLSRSLLVVDEVHASDRYMSQLLSALLDHHLKVGGRALLLSATLGSAAKNMLIKGTQTQLEPLTTAIQSPYPALTLSNGFSLSAESQSDKPKQVSLQTVPYTFELKNLVEYLVPALQAGARVLVILNTVARVNELFGRVESHPDIKREWLFSCSGHICPHHGRFAPQDRVLLDKAITTQFGKGSPSGPLLLVGSQTLEQSLDIDADLLITDLVPSDVLLQRIGRLHRHRRQRPEGYNDAKCIVVVPNHSLEEALDGKGDVIGKFRKVGFGSVYEDLRTLERTWQSIEEFTEIEVPRDNRKLVELATHPESLSLLNSKKWEAHAQSIEGKSTARAIAAHTVINTYDKYFGEFHYIDSGLKVTTRLGVNQFQVPLDRPAQSPFGQELSEILIPGHMAPSDQEEFARVESEGDATIVIKWGTKHYRYSKLGLEAME